MRRAGPLVLVLLLAACQPEEKLIRYKPFLGNLKDAETQTPPVEPAGSGASVPTAGGDDQLLIRENPDGSKTVYSRSGLQLMANIQQLLRDGEDKLFAEQVLSEITRQEFLERGLRPEEAFRTLKGHEKDIAKLFARMPLGEHSPNVNMEPIGRNIFRVRVTGRSREDLEWTGFDMSLEKGNWKLRWFVR
jgi:hypothetical protein